MKILTLALAGSLIAATGFATAASAEQPGSLSMGARGAPRVSHAPPGALGFKNVRRNRNTQISPHIGLPGISGFPLLSSSRSAPRISPHIGLPGISGFPATSHRRRHHHGGHFPDEAFIGYWGYESDGDGYVDTIPMADEFGFFASGGEVTTERGKPVYHYDRSYPYDWYGGAPKSGGPRAESGLRCRVQPVWDDAQRVDVPVRVCTPA